MKTLATLIIALSMLIASDLFAQSDLNREVFPNQAQHVQHNSAVMQFSGDFMLAFPSIDRFLPNLPSSVSNNIGSVNVLGSDNITELTQTGMSNTAGINILGNQNSIELDQDGNNNLSLINVWGSRNSIDYAQIGNNNYLGLNFIGSDHSHQYIQQGNNHAVQFNGISLPITVEQTGSAGMTVIITNN
jgi:hypothetical protein